MTQKKIGRMEFEMKKGTIISLIALLVSVIGLLVALIAYCKKRENAKIEDDLIDFYEDVAYEAGNMEPISMEADESLLESATDTVEDMIAQAEEIVSGDEKK